MSKSPISLLQELLIKQGYVPIYNYGTSKTNQFICRVDYKHFNAEGIGSSKKDAKNNAAENMLLLLAKNNETPILPSIINNMQVSTSNKIYQPISPLQMQLNDVNYIGLLQEFCIQQNITIKNISYELVDEDGPAHMKIFTIKASLGSLCEKGSGQCKKIAKQEAAKKLLQHLHPNINKLLDGNTHKTMSKEVLEDTIRNLGVRISECVISKPTLPTENLPKIAKKLYLTHVDKRMARQDYLLKDLHHLFDKTYSNKIVLHNIKRKMQTVKNIYTDHAVLTETIQDIINMLRVRVERTILPSRTKDYIISLRLLSYPNITQLGIGETKAKAEIEAMYNIIMSILILTLK